MDTICVTFLCRSFYRLLIIIIISIIIVIFYYNYFYYYMIFTNILFSLASGSADEGYLTRSGARVGKWPNKE